MSVRSRMGKVSRPSNCGSSPTRLPRRHAKERTLMDDEHGNGNQPEANDAALHVAFVLDKSGSMRSIEEAVVAGYTDYLRELRTQDSETRFSLTTFDTHFEHVWIGEPL